MVILVIMISTCGLAQFMTFPNDLHLSSYPSVAFIASFLCRPGVIASWLRVCGRSHLPIVLISVDIDEFLCEWTPGIRGKQRNVVRSYLLS